MKAKMKANFTIEQLIQKVRDLAEQNPDYVYEKIENDKFKTVFCLSTSSSCSYLKSKNPGNEDKGCIFGQAILNLQPDLKPELETPFSISTILSHIGINGNDFEKKWCAAVQAAQDSQYSWKDAINKADLIKNKEEIKWTV